jgi:FkbM family methyltransferase
MGLVAGKINAHIFRRFGFQIARHEPPPIIKTLNNFSFDTVIDVGANIGQFAATLNRYGFTGKIYSVEPSSEAYNKLLVNSKKSTNWHILPRCALGKTEGIATLNISKNSYSSSLLQILPKHTSVAPDSQFIKEESVTMQTLDTMFNKPDFLRRSCFLKIDVQGFEEEVLAGGIDLMKKIGGIKIELSLSKLYEGQSLFKRLIDLIEDYGFSIWNIEPGFQNIQSGETYQCDAIMIHNSLL